MGGSLTAVWQMGLPPPKCSHLPPQAAAVPRTVARLLASEAKWVGLGASGAAREACACRESPQPTQPRFSFSSAGRSTATGAVPPSAFQGEATAAAAAASATLATQPSGPLDAEAGAGVLEPLLSSHRPSAGTRAAGADELAGYADPEAPASPGQSEGSGATARAVVVTLLSLQLGWGLWLLPSDYARLGWVPASVTIAIVAALTTYSASLFPRLIAATEGAILFGDVGAAAYGSIGRGLVYAFVYGLDATRCVILHLAASQALQHATGSPAGVSLATLGAIVAVGAWALAQVRSLPHMSGFLAAGTAGQVRERERGGCVMVFCFCFLLPLITHSIHKTNPHTHTQLFAICVVLHTLVTAPDPHATHAAFAWSDSPVKAAVAVLNVFFAYGGQVRGCLCVKEREKPCGGVSKVLTSFF